MLSPPSINTTNALAESALHQRQGPRGAAFDVEAAPWPDGADGAPRVDVAHANIIQRSYGTNPDKKARTMLAHIAEPTVGTGS